MRRITISPHSPPHGLARAAVFAFVLLVAMCGITAVASAFTCPADCDCFAVGADSRTYYSEFNKTLQFIKPDKAQFDFMVFPGDMEYILVNKGSYTDVELSGLQTYWCVGNHEMDVGDERNISNLNTTRANVIYYYNDSLNTSYIVESDKLYLVVLDEYIEASTGNIPAGSGLYNWLDAKLALLDKGKKIFTVGHEPAYPENAHIGNSLDQYPADRDALWSLFDHHSVEAYFCGHTHYYSRNSSMLNVTQVDVGNMRWWGDGNSTIAYVVANDSTAMVYIYSNSTKGEVLDLIASYDVTNNYGADSRLLYHADNAANDTANKNWGTPRNGVDTQANTGVTNLGREGHFVAANDEYVQVPTNDSLNFGTGNFSISLWFNTSGTGTFVEKSYDGYSGTGGAGWVLFIWDDARLEFSLSDTPAGAFTTVRTPTGTYYNDSQWHHVVISVGRGTNQVGWYVDGVHLENDDLGSRSGSVSGDHDLWIGANYNKGAAIDREFDGDMNEVAIYNKTLNATEVSTLYNSSNGYQHTGSEAGLVSAWHMNEDTWVVLDSSGNGNNGTLTGTCYGEGVHNTGFKLDGTADYVFIPHDNSLDLTGKEMALEAWVKWGTNPGSGNSWAAIINKYGDNEWRLQHNSGNAHFEFAVGGTGVTSTTTIQEDVWYHVVGTYNSTHLLMYVDGELENTASCSSAIPVSSSDVYIGRRTLGDRHFNGTIDEVAIYNRSLSAAEVLAHYNEFAPPAGTIPPDPVNLANTTGNFWINHTWQPGSGVVTDSYNVSVNSVWHNTTPAHYNDTYTAHAWQNVTVYAYNTSDTGTLSAGSISQDTQIPNNPVTITNTSDWSGDPGNNVYVDYDATDADSDTPTFSCSRTDLFTDFDTANGTGNWTAVSGTYYVDFGVSDGYGSTSNYTMTITVSGAPLTYNCTCGDICVNTNGWWYHNNTFNASAVPIQDAVNNATAGETICVKDGTYNENVNVATRLTIRSENGSSATTVNASNPNDHVFEVTVNYVNISGFTVENATGNSKAGIFLTGASYCNISYNAAIANWHGIYLYNSCGHNNITNNNASFSIQIGVLLHWVCSNNNVIDNVASSNNFHGFRIKEYGNYNLIKNNTANNNIENGFYLFDSCNYNTIIDNTMNFNADGIRVAKSCHDVNISNNTLANNTKGFHIIASHNNSFTCNWVHNSTGHGFYLTNVSPAVIGGLDSVDNNISYNNIITNGNYNGTSGGWEGQFNTTQSSDVEAKHNYWGTTVSSEIAASIEENTGNVTYDPFLTWYSPCAPGYQEPESYIPPDPKNIQSTSGNFWVNHTWDAGTGNVTDSYNISVNSVWHNTSPAHYNDTYTAHAWQNVTVYAYNSSDSGTLSAGNITQDRQIPNNAITITNTSDWSGNAGNNVYVDYDATDPDGDAPTFSCNRTDLFTDFDTANGTGNWTAVSGTYYVDFGVSDGYGSTDNYTMTITVSSPCTCGDICVNTNGWWRDGGVLNASATPIKSAEANSIDGDIIFIYGGDYNESVTVLGNQNLSFVGEGRDIVNIEGTGVLFDVRESNTNISGVNLSVASGQAGIRLYDVQNCYIDDIKSDGGAQGVRFYGSSNNSLKNSTVNGSSAAGIELTFRSTTGHNATYNIIDNCTVTDCIATEGRGIHLVERCYYNEILNCSSTGSYRSNFYFGVNTTNNAVRNCSFNGSIEYYGIRMYQSSYNTIDNCQICNNHRSGVFNSFSDWYRINNSVISNNLECGLSFTTGTNNTIESNYIENNTDYGIASYSSSSDNLIYNNRFDNTNNAYSGSSSFNIWNTTKQLGTNIIGGLYIGGNNWSDYAGSDTTGDGIGNTNTPYNNGITNGGDYLPLTAKGSIPFVCPENCDCFVVGGDSLTQYSRFNLTLQFIKNYKDQLDYMVWVGDMSYVTVNKENYSDIELPGIPSHWVVGNHEMDVGDERNISNLNTTFNNIVYYYNDSLNTSYIAEYNHSYVIVLDEYIEQPYGNIPVGSGLWNWLKSSIASLNHTKQIFAFGHEPAYPEHRHVGSCLDQFPSDRDALWSLFDNYSVEAYFCGHTHWYYKNSSMLNVTQIDIGNMRWEGGTGGDGNSTVVFVSACIGNSTAHAYSTSIVGSDFDLIETYNITNTYLVSDESTYLPPDPQNIQSTSGNFWVNHTWDAGTGNVTDSYNISVNSVWHNTTTPAHYNDTYTAHAWQNITIYAYNTSGSGTLSAGNISQDAQIPNNPITITNTSDWSGDAGNNVYVDYDATDADSDTPTFSCNRTDLFTDFDTTNGTGNWTAVSGTYYVDFGASDGWGSTSNYTMTITVSVTPTVVTLLAQDPSTIYRNSTGAFNISWGISHSSAGLNNTSVSFIWTVYDVAVGCYNHSIRPPSNDKAAPLIMGGTNYGKIQRGDNRNDTLYFESNITITGGNVYHWSGCDERADRLSIVPVNSTYSKVFLNSSFAAMLGNMYYLDRTDQQGAVMTKQRIYKNNPLLIKIWDIEKMKTRSGHIIVGYADTHMAGSSTNGVSVYYLNSSYDPAGSVDPLDSPYAAYISTHTESTWVDYVHTIRNSTYIKTFEVNETSLPVNTTPTGYLYFTSTEPSQHKAFCINISDGTTITNRSFADTSTLWTGTGAPLILEPYTPNIFVSWRNTDRQFQTKLYAADNSDVWGNSTLHTSDIEVSSFDPTIPIIDHFSFDSTTDYVMNGTYSDTIAVAVGVATDPDGGSVTHNLSLWYANRTFVAIINNTFTDADRTNLYAHIDFNTIPYYSETEEYTLKVVATDDEACTSESWLGVNFTLGTAHTPPDPVNIANTTGNFWVNHTWDAGTGNVTDSYNISVNSVWHNTTTPAHYNDTYTAHAWQNITIYAYNTSGSGTLSSGNVSQDTQIPNNPITITNTSDWSGDPGNNVYVDYDATDLDSDTPTFSCNRTDLFTDFDTTNGTGNWTAVSGTYYVDFGVSDGYGSIDNYTMTITVGTPNYTPPDPENLANTTGNFWVNHTWSAGWQDWYLITGGNGGTFSGFNWTGVAWESYSGLVNGLYDVGYHSAPTVFEKDGTWYLITGNSSGEFIGFNWTGSTWQNDSEIVRGLGNIGQVSKPCVFQKTGTWHLIAGSWTGDFYGFSWNGSGWQSSGIASGISPYPNNWNYAEVNVFQKDSTWYCITGESNPFVHGHNWTGSIWQDDDGIVSGISGACSFAPCAFQKDGTWYLVAGGRGGAFSGYNWAGSAWQHNSAIVSGLGDIGGYSTPRVFNMNTSITAAYNVTDSYNVSVNGVWHNGTVNASYNDTYTPHAWQNVTVYSYNTSGSGTLSAGSTSQNTQIPNNPITITNTSNWSGSPGKNVYVDYDATDADSDTPTFSCNRTDLFTDFSTSTGKGNWTVVEGVHYVDFGVSDGWGSTSNYTMMICTPSYTPFDPTTLANTTGNFWINHTWQEGVSSGEWYLIVGDGNGAYTGYSWTGSTWQSDSAITGGIDVRGTCSKPSLFQKDGTWYLIAGNDTGHFNGYNWTGSTWQSDTAIAGGLGDTGDCAAPSIFQKNGTWYLIAGDMSGVFNGFNWTGSTWQSDSAIAGGLGSVGQYAVPYIFQKNNTWYLTAGNLAGTVTGFNWTGSTWQSDSAITDGLGNIGTMSTPSIFQKNDTWYLITGHVAGTFAGFNWTGSTWQSDSAIAGGISSVPGMASPVVFNSTVHTAPNVTDSYNVRVNGVWHNGTVNTHYNDTYAAHAWQNITVYAYNTSGADTLSSGNVSQDTQIPNNPITITNTSDWSGDAGNNVYVDYDATDLDSDTPTFSCNRTDLFTDFSTSTGKGNWTAAAGTYYVDFGVSDGWGSISNYTMTITVAELTYLPPDPTTLQNTTGNFWVNHTWDAGTGNVTDSYNVSVNSGWHNTTTPAHYNDTYTAHAWQNITVFAYNTSGSGTLSAGSISQNTQIPNNPITITNTSDWSGDPGNNVYVDYDATDLDSDTPTFSCNRTDLFTDFDTTNGTGNWTAVSGTYYVDFGVSDSYGSTDNYTMTITVSGAPPTYNCTCGDICVNTSGWWYNNSAFNASAVPIQDAVNNATAGETICVKDGTYNENVNVATRLTIRSENGSSATTVNASDSNDHVFEVTVNYVNISGFKVENATHGSGIRLIGASYCNISDNAASDNRDGIHLLSGSNNNDLTSNTANTNAYAGIFLSGSNNNDLTTNIANSNPGYGIVMDSSKNNTLSGCSAIGNGWGIVVMYSSNNNTISGSSALHNTYHGIYMVSSSNNTISGSTPKWNYQHGIYMSGSTNNNLTSNEVNANQQYGIYLSGSTNNNLTSNRIHSNWIHGIYLSGSNNNTIYNNRFQNFPNNAWDDGSNIWNTTPTPGQNIYGGSWLGGNHWTDYAGVDLSGDGLGDTLIPYNSSGNIVNGGDRHPLVQAAASYIPPDPTTLANTTGNFWVNHTWDAGTGNVTDSYNVSVNSVWHNTTTPAHYNDTYTAHAWQNSTIYAYNTSGTGTLSSGNVSQDTQIPNNPVTITNTSDWSGDPGNNVYVDYDATDLDSDTPTFSCNRTDLFTDFDTTNGTGNWTAVSGTYYVDFGVSDSYGSTDNYTMTITVSGAPPTEYIPPDPTNIANTTGNFWVNHTWDAGTGNVTNSYNISVNSVWHNTTTPAYYNDTYTAHVWQNITVYAYNTSGSGTLSAGNVSQDTQIPNNPITITNTSDWSGNPGANVYVDYDATDLDSDTPTFSCNRTDLFTDFDTANGTGNWTAVAGTYYVDFGVSDGYGSTDNYTMRISQNAAPDKPTLVAPANGATGTSTNPTLRVTVTDPDGDLMNVTFYQQGGSQIGSTQTGIANGGTASVVWSGRSYSTTYYWYAVANDGTAGTQSDIWHFRTQSSGGGGSSHTISITGCNDWSGNAGTQATIDFGYWNADSDNPVFTTNATEGTLNAATGVWTWSTTAGDVGVYNWWFRVKNAYGNSDDCTVTVTVYTADTPLGLGSTTGNFWVDHTWNAVAGASEYRVRVNGVWHNGTATHYLNTLMAPHGWSNITLASYNASTGVSSFITDDVQIPNNPITITNYSDQNVFVGDNVYVDLNYADLDGDTPTFSCSRTDLFTDFSTATGTGNWTTATNGTYEIDFGVTDGWGAISNCTVKVRVGERPTLPTTIPISIWITITVLMMCMVVYTLHTRGYVQKIFGGMISVTMAYILSQQIVSGNVVQITSLMSSTDVIITEKVEVVIPELAYLLLFVAAIMSLVTSVFIVKYIQFLYKKANAIKSKEEEL